MQDYISDVDKAWSNYVATKDAAAFASEMRSINSSWLQEFARNGYNAAGGIGESYLKAGNRATDFINSYLDNFQKDLMVDPNAALRWRALLYPREGHRLAYVLGQQAAMEERGAKAWQRRLHPELSETGPCALCIADSMLIHPITEPFELLHVGDVCSVQEVVAYYPVEPESVQPGETPETEMPVPSRPSVSSVIQMLKDSIANLGKIGKSIIRRIRGK